MIAEISIAVGTGMLGIGIPAGAWIFRNTGKGNGPVKQVDGTHVFKDVCDERHGNISRRLVEIKDELATQGGKIGSINDAVIRIEENQNGGH